MSMVADCHNDLALLVHHHHLNGNESYFRDSMLPQLTDNDVGIQVAPIFIDDAYRPEGALRHALLVTELMLREFDKNSDVVSLCATGRELRDALAAGKVAFVLALEGCEHIGTDIELLESFFRLGIRTASFTHFGRTPLADGSAEDAAGSRLTEAGVEAVRLMESLGMLVDVSHLNMAGTDHVLEIATRPVLASHSNARALCDVHRNITDERLAAIAATGGIIGANFFPMFVDPVEPAVQQLVAHIQHMVSVAGIDHVGLGPDFMRELADTTGAAILDIDLAQVLEGMRGDPGDFPIVAEALSSAGFNDTDTDKIMGGNVLRFLERNLPA
jgi:membrane dipeptidase